MSNDRYGSSVAVNPVAALKNYGQSVWLDYLRRSLFTSGEFRRLIVEDGLRGATSNPSIFEKAIAGSTDYLYALQQIERSHDIEPMALYEALAIRDIHDAADLLHQQYEATFAMLAYLASEDPTFIKRDRSPGDWPANWPANCGKAPRKTRQRL